MPPNFFFAFSRELLVQSEANSYSTAIENHDFMLWRTCCIRLDRGTKLPKKEGLSLEKRDSVRYTLHSKLYTLFTMWHVQIVQHD